jgi:hypothetical protein
MDAGANIHASGEIVERIDTSSSGRSALKWAAEYARSTGQRLHAVYVFNYNPAGGWHGPLVSRQQLPTVSPTN